MLCGMSQKELSQAIWQKDPLKLKTNVETEYLYRIIITLDKTVKVFFFDDCVCLDAKAQILDTEEASRG